MFNLFKKPPTDISKILAMKNIDEKIVALHSFCGQHYNNWTETEKVVSVVLDMESEVMNGGFCQYFQNSAGDQWKDALISLFKIGAQKSAELLTKALSVFVDSKPSPIQEERQIVVNMLGSEQLEFLDTLDQEFYKYEDNIPLLIIGYAEKNKFDFSNS